MATSVENNGWNEHKLVIYSKLDNLDEKIQGNTNANEKQFEALNRIELSVSDMRGELRLFRMKIAGLSAAVSAIIAFISRHL